MDLPFQVPEALPLPVVAPDHRSASNHAEQNPGRTRSRGWFPAPPTRLKHTSSRSQASALSALNPTARRPSSRRYIPNVGVGTIPHSLWNQCPHQARNNPCHHCGPLPAQRRPHHQPPTPPGRHRRRTGQLPPRYPRLPTPQEAFTQLIAISPW